MKVHRKFLALPAVLLSACGGGGGPSSPIQVAYSPPLPTAIQVGDTASLAATVANDGSASGVKWTVSCNSSDCGSFNPIQTTSGAQTTYTPPATVPGGGTVIITAASMADSTKSCRSEPGPLRYRRRLQGC
jgi:hypothetical protein